ncbi:guanine-1-methyltransferase-domain-containing protein [Dichomitus squalens]|uniref:tRNA (guanine(9)-N1)-methyltransferase n=1 Tax=Dichomitus squalens TaxID=114155 RepID=A0A4Q9NRB9_9APHY|nr:guanine-1-methyltransferase-domain-containing protein [Dichomitus squalens]TBU63351.1 guanine-1-methyltransferase-domain-containing protein [Dichomitus squalens]
MLGDPPDNGPPSPLPDRTETATAPAYPAPDSKAEPTSTAATETAAQAKERLSKKAQKKLAKAEHIAERKKERRAAEKERKKEKRREHAQKRDAGELEPEERERKKQKTEQGPRTPFGARVVVDLGFDDRMTENEIKSLTGQLAYTYSVNKKAVHPFSSLLFTGIDGRTKARMDGMSDAAYKRWVGAEWWEESYERLWEGKSNSGEGTQEDKEDEATEAGGTEGKKGQKKRPRKQEPSRAEKATVVYLTADSEEELTELKEGETYIIGGIVDHNRYKNLCLEKSQTQGIRSARLPIGTYLAELRTRKVLTVNQTFEILVKWVETRNWEQALYSVIPKRKFKTEGRKRGGGGASSKDGDSVAEEEAKEGGGLRGGDGDLQVVDVADLEDEAEHEPGEPLGGTVLMES